MDPTPENAFLDTEARAALWKAICVASDDARYRFNVGSIRGVDDVEVCHGTSVPEVPTWRLVEAISLLGVIIRSEKASVDHTNLFGKTGPIEIHEDGTVRY